jgi:hypothetical protein
VEPRDDGTLFVAAVGSMGAAALKTGLTKLRTLKHPNILTFLDTLEVSRTLSPKLFIKLFIPD